MINGELVVLALLSKWSLFVRYTPKEVNWCHVHLLDLLQLHLLAPRGGQVGPVAPHRLRDYGSGELLTNGFRSGKCCAWPDACGC